MAQDRSINFTLAPTTDARQTHKLSADNTTGGDVSFFYDSQKLTSWAQYITLEQQIRTRLLGAGFK